MVYSVWDEIKKKTDEHGYMSEVDRMSERVKRTAEVFTPTDVVIDMIKNNIDLYGPGETVIDPTCGDGQFLVVIKWLKILYFKMKPEDALNEIAGIDIMRDNVDLCKKRLGGGTIVMGDLTQPEVRLYEQTEEEYFEMFEYIYKGSKRYFKHIKKRKDMINKARLHYKKIIAKKQKAVSDDLTKWL
jgi:hypothetical protein